MPDRENVVKGLRCIAGDVVWCAHCPYSDANGSGRGDRCKRDCAKKALVWLKEQPEIIRCKDCKHGEIYTAINGVLLSIMCDGVKHRPEWFCADGERRDDDA